MAAGGGTMSLILVVEDDRNQRTLYSRELTEDGYEVVMAADGKEALRVFGERTPDVVVLDIQMPNMDGIETLGRLLSADRKIPVILHTAYSSYKTNFMTWSADAYVVKSSDLSELKAKIREVLAGSGR
jgi:DNA-binding response OmpR family regulator